MNPSISPEALQRQILDALPQLCLYQLQALEDFISVEMLDLRIALPQPPPMMEVIDEQRLGRLPARLR